MARLYLTIRFEIPEILYPVPPIEYICWDNGKTMFNFYGKEVMYGYNEDGTISFRLKELIDDDTDEILSEENLGEICADNLINIFFDEGDDFNGYRGTSSGRMYQAEELKYSIVSISS